MGMNEKNYEGLRKQLDNGSLDIPSQITILEIAYNLEQQLQTYKDKEDKLRKIFDKFPYTCACGQGQQDEIESELLQILNEGSDGNEQTL